MTHICRSCSNHHICMITPPPLAYTQSGTDQYQILHNAMHPKLKTNNILQFNIIHNFIRVSCGRYVIKKGNFLHLTRCDVLIRLLSSCMWRCAVWQNSTNISHEPFLPSGKKTKAVTSTIMVLCLSTRLHCAAADKTVTFPHLLPHCQVTGIPNDSVNRLQPNGHSTSLGKAFCHCCLWTSKIFWMVSQHNFFHSTVCAVSNTPH
jgi:hypothetical protein